LYTAFAVAENMIDIEFADDVFKNGHSFFAGYMHFYACFFKSFVHVFQRLQLKSDMALTAIGA
jgi:hypothetical protein